MELPFTEDDRARFGSALAAMRAAERARTSARLEREKAEAVERGLRDRAAAIEARFVRPVVAPDADRVARLLSGESPASLDQAEAEACEARNRVLKVEQSQLHADADAVAARAAELAAAVQRAEADLETARRAFVEVFGAVVQARYHEAAAGFARGPWRTLFLAAKALRAEGLDAAEMIERDAGGFRLHFLTGGADGAAGTLGDARRFADTNLPDPLGTAAELVAALSASAAAGGVR